tara:strand:- start:151 stop:909 length:759 start_codon:yes stop_codon:yes gene_type:complete
MKNISVNEINQFDQKGYLVKKNFFKKSFINQISKEINLLKSKDLKKKVDRYFGMSVGKNRQSILVRIENFYNKSKNLTKLIDDKSIREILSELFRSKATLFKEKINFKPPGCGPDKLHQDSQAGWNRYAKDYINVLLSVEKSTINNGCLHIDISGNNCSKLMSKKMKPLKMKELKNPKFKKLLLGEGDLVFFNSYTPHFSYSNNSKKSRSQIYLTYNKEKDGKFRSKYISDKRKNFPPNDERSANKKYAYKV